MLLRNTMLWLAANETAKRVITRSRVSRPLARRFAAGETASEALDVVRELNSRGALATLDYLGENVTSADEARAVATTYSKLLRSIAEQRLNCNISLKLTALGLDIERRLCVDNLRSILDTARDTYNFVRIDMEGSPYTQATLDIFEELYCGEGYTNTGIVLQSYLRRTAADVERAVELKARVRLCKGAYKEPSTIAFASKAEVDQSYRMLARRLLHDGNYPGLATHDAEIIEWVKRITRDDGIGHERFEFQMLYGVRRDLQRRLVAEGYNLRVYVPYGEAWYPYLMRRLAERPANVLFVLRALGHG
jgi:proline dehydrogenase